MSTTVADVMKALEPLGRVTFDDTGAEDCGQITVVLDEDSGPYLLVLDGRYFHYSEGTEQPFRTGLYIGLYTDAVAAEPAVKFIGQGDFDPVVVRMTAQFVLRPHGIDKRGHQYVVTDDGPMYISPCCGAAVTFHDADLCCKSCWSNVPDDLSMLPLIKTETTEAAK